MAPLYSRYIPPTSSKVDESVRTSNSKNGELAEKEKQESSNGRKKRKRVGADDIEQESHKHAKKDKSGLKEKKKAHKRSEEKVERENDTQQENEKYIQGETEEHVVSPDSDDTETTTLPSKHSAVFSKFQKAAERSARISAEEAAAEGAREQDGNEHEAQPELHGMCAYYYTDPLIVLSLF